MPRTSLYSLNVADNEVLTSIMGSFQGGGIPGEIQLGSAWWFNDTIDGMQAQLRYGDWIESGQLPEDMKLLQTIIEGIC